MSVITSPAEFPEKHGNHSQQAHVWRLSASIAGHLPCRLTGADGFRRRGSSRRRTAGGRQCPPAAGRTGAATARVQKSSQGIQAGGRLERQSPGCGQAGNPRTPPRPTVSIEDALDSARRWAELDPESDEALLYVAQLYLRTGDVRKARRSFADLLERDDEPVDKRLMALIPFLSEEDPEDAYTLNEPGARLRTAVRPERPNDAVGVLALQAGDHEEAASRAKKALDAKPEWTRPKLLYARSLLLGGDEAKAIDYAARIVGDDPDPDPEARLELAIMYLSADRDDDALSQVNQILLEQPARTDALRLMAIINFRQENLDAAWADFQDLLSSGRHTMDALYYLARISDYRGERDRAFALYSQVTAGPNAIMSQRRASGILSERGDTSKALEHLQRFGEQHPGFAVDMIQAQGQLLASEGQYDEALEIYDRVVSYRPDSERAVAESRRGTLPAWGAPTMRSRNIAGPCAAGRTARWR
ncbi:MAG: tetratricopeptide repeat protein [Woeseiaceae bacterium]|nr:tetratricopeptide repeat protein [Woeseiaceae bacterium]